jgi:formylmethanofuran dehydrogenase subunit A
MGSVPSTFATGYKYAGMGYTTAFDAAIPPLAARHVHEEFEDTPCIDKGFFVLMGNNHYVMQSIQRNEPERLRTFIAWLLGAAKGFTPKIVNPAASRSGSSCRAGNVHGLDENVAHFGVTARQIIEQEARAVDELRLPHSVHVHANNLGMPGNWHTTLETMKTLGGSRGHLAHIQFHSYGGGEGDENTFNSKAVELVGVCEHPPNSRWTWGRCCWRNHHDDCGRTARVLLSNAFKSKWFSSDTEMESGCGIAPDRVQEHEPGSFAAMGDRPGVVSAGADPWRVVMSTDHPNGGSFLAYPQIIQL